ncbi:MAG: tetratricopeptide repeat protein [Candidatus Thalassarchaeum sp.]|nr:tetratricopeptide repeat protein [Candidatus Thalassarchaeum sp.]
MATHEVAEALSEARKIAEEGPPSTAIDRYRSILETSPESATAWYCLGVLYSQTGDSGLAIEAFENSDRLFPNHGATISNLAFLLKSTDPIRAREYALSALVQYPDDTRLNEISQSPATDTKQKERIFIESRPIVQAIDIPDALISDYSGSMEDEARTLTQTGDHAGAVAIWKGILSNSPKSPEVWRGLADALLAAGYPDRYEQCNRRADSLDDEHRTSLEEQQPVDEIGSISLIDAVENVREAAVDVVEDRGDIDEAISWFNMGTNLLNEGNNEEALTSFEKAIGGCPKDETELRMKAQNGRGNALFNAGRYAESVVAYHAAIGMDPSNVSGRTLFNMGSSYAAVEMYDDAIKCFNQAIGRGMDKSEHELCEKQISRCRLLSREQAKRQVRPSN